MNQHPSRDPEGRVAMANEFRVATSATPLMEWQPIETAPKDGTWFLGVMAGYRPTLVRWFNDRKRDIEGWQDDEAEDPISPRDWPLTHWLPFPELPKVPHE